MSEFAVFPAEKPISSEDMDRLAAKMRQLAIERRNARDTARSEGSLVMEAAEALGSWPLTIPNSQLNELADIEASLEGLYIDKGGNDE